MGRETFEGKIAGLKILVEAGIPEVTSIIEGLEANKDSLANLSPDFADVIMRRHIDGPVNDIVRLVGNLTPQERKDLEQ